MPMTNATARGALDELRFLRSLVVRPRSIGAIAPSSPALARKIAEQIDPRTEGMVIELGPGTGVVTDALIARGIAEERLIAIESDPDMAQLVRERFPKLRVVEGDATIWSAASSGMHAKVWLAWCPVCLCSINRSRDATR